MPHVSPKKVDKKTLEKLHSLLFSSFTSKGVSRKEQYKFFDELLTDTEKVMLAKRLTAITLLGRGFSSYHTAKILRLSEVTTRKLQLQLEAGKFKHIIKIGAAQGKSAINRYIENLISPLPSYGKSFLKHLEDRY